MDVVPNGRQPDVRESVEGSVIDRQLTMPLWNGAGVLELIVGGGDGWVVF